MISASVGFQCPQCVAEGKASAPVIKTRLGAKAPTRPYVTFAIIALVFGIANGLVKPVVKMLSFPITLLTLGLAGIVINAVLFLAAAWVTNQVGGHVKVGDFPPTLLTQATVVAALLGSLVLGIVSAIARMVIPD